MARGALTTVLSVGLSAGVVVLSFFGCFTPLDEETGKCQAADAGASDAGPGDCTIPKCNADGTPAHENVPNAEKKVCFRGENEGVCVDGDCALICETQATPCKCATDTACPDDKQCIDWACIAGACISKPIREGELLDPLETGDCKKSVCQGGNPTSINDDGDVAADIDADCLKPTCVNGTPMLAPDDMDTAADMPKDCQQPACKNGVSMPKPDTGDVPDATGCTGFKCSPEGMIEPKPEPLNTQCTMMGGTDGVCDGKGACKLENGAPCTNASAMDCLSGNCADGVCCDTGCANECKSCNQAMKLGECTNIPPLVGDSSYTDSFGTPNVSCSAPFYCNGSGKCLGGLGAPCTTGSGCIGGNCSMPSNLCLGAKGEPCTNGGQCASGTCTMNKCT